MESGLFRFEFEENTSDLGVGDRVLVHSGAISSTPSYHGYVRSVDAHQGQCPDPLNNISEDTLERVRGRSTVFHRDQTSIVSQTALFDFLRAPPVHPDVSSLGIWTPSLLSGQLTKPTSMEVGPV